jgi:hypothetical protein
MFEILATIAGLYAILMIVVVIYGTVSAIFLERANARAKKLLDKTNGK